MHWALGMRLPTHWEYLIKKAERVIFASFGHEYPNISKQID